MTDYLFIFGRTPELSFQELRIFFPTSKRMTNTAALVSRDDKIPLATIDSLGGTIKLGEVLGNLTSLSPQEILPYFPRSSASLTFGISIYGGERVSEGLLSTIKSNLENELKSHIRYVKPSSGSELSSIVVQKQNIYELLLLKLEKGYLVAKTLAVQAFEEWGKRDYGRPFADPKVGMLPPKVARMIVNIAGGGKNEATILDPFCGMGTVVAEGILGGHHMYGSDISPDIIKRAEANIAWLISTYRSIREGSHHFFVSDAVHISTKLLPESLDAIVTEPYMGPSNIGSDALKVRNIAKGLEKLFLGCFKEWKKVLKPHGVILISIPSIRLKSGEEFVKKPIDMCETLGYTKVFGPIEYGRPQAVVKRNFYLFRKLKLWHM